MLEMVLSLDGKEVKEFNRWYKDAYYYDHLQDLIQ
jgi:hypothetical protein